jgi:hypothetical protein
VEGFEVEADEFKRHCTQKGVTLHTIEQAFEGCKPKAPKPVPPASPNTKTVRVSSSTKELP